MTKNEKINNLKDLFSSYTQEINNLNNDNEAINISYTKKRNEIILNAGRAEKRFTASLYRFGAGILLSFFTIGILSTSPIAVCLAGGLFGFSLTDFIVSTIGLNKYNKQAQNLEKLDEEKTLKINNNLNQIKVLEKKKQKASKMIDELSSEVYFSKSKNKFENSITTQSKPSDKRQATNKQV